MRSFGMRSFTPVCLFVHKQFLGDADDNDDRNGRDDRLTSLLKVIHKIDSEQLGILACLILSTVFSLRFK